jgi:hypothetical protein
MEKNNGIIEQIHHDINTCYLNKIQSCNEYIDRNEINSDELKLATLGFKSYEDEAAKDVELKKSRDYIELINRLKIDYPYKKFIKYEDLGTILKKYDLVLDTPDRFIGKIPKLNQKNILNFKLKEIDMGYNVVPDIYVNNTKNTRSSIYEITNIILNEIARFSSLRFTSFGRSESYDITRIINDISTYDPTLVDKIVHGLTDGSFSTLLQSIQRGSVPRIKNYFNLNGEHFILNQHGDSIFISNWFTEDRSNLDINVYPKEVTNPCNFWILATADQFNLGKDEFVIGGKIIKAPKPTSFQIRLKDDPIILKPIKEGLISVSMWGEEASFPEFINPENN